MLQLKATEVSLETIHGLNPMVFMCLIFTASMNMDEVSVKPLTSILDLL